MNWVEEKLLGGYRYNHTTPVRVMVLFLFCGRACELGEEEAAGRVQVQSHHARLGYSSTPFCGRACELGGGEPAGRVQV